MILLAGSKGAIASPTNVCVSRGEELATRRPAIRERGWKSGKILLHGKRKTQAISGYRKDRHQQKTVHDLIRKGSALEVKGNRRGEKIIDLLKEAGESVRTDVQKKKGKIS